MAKMFKREDFNIVTESPHQTEPSPSRFCKKKDETSAASGGKLLKVVAVIFGLLSVLQVSLSISFHLGFFTQNISKCEAEVDLLRENNNNLTKERDNLQKTNNNLLCRTHQLESSNGNLMRDKEQMETMYKSLAKDQEWVEYGSSLYYMSTMKTFWQNSRDDCRRRGADLIIINNKAEQDFAVKHHTRMWIGLTDAESEGVWKWVDGSLLQKTKSWCPEEPNNFDEKEHCGECNARRGCFNGDGCWNDIHCDHRNYWICEK